MIFTGIWAMQLELRACVEISLDTMLFHLLTIWYNQNNLLATSIF